jgi:hypothetical protein
MSGAYPESQSGSFQNNWLQTKVSKNLSALFPLSPSPDSFGRAQGSDTEKWCYRELARQSLDHWLCCPVPCLARTQVAALQSILSRQRGSSSSLRPAWNTATLPLPTACSSLPLFLPSAFLSGFLWWNWETSQALKWTLSCHTDLGHPGSSPARLTLQQAAMQFPFPLCAHLLLTQGTQDTGNGLYF